MKNQSKKYLIYFLLIIFTAINFSGCTSSKLVDVWKEQSFKRGSIDNFLVIAINNNKTKRRIWEKSFVDELTAKGIKATGSYHYYPNEAPAEKDIPELFKNKFDGIVLIQKVSEEVRKYRVPGSIYYEPWGFRRWYGWRYSRVYVPGYVDKERITQLEISVWEPSEDGKMIWSALTETINSDLPQNFSKEISSLIIPKMISDRIILPKGKKGGEVDSSF
ncbi:MAG: hypothetical protein A3J84_02045 [Ignavibacteria bacterium RIFOXYA2_FULL_37_17]|nr:MAG: hypothetical protein A3J84_02045 [Ignavibacteria bacterium RIFOXYA2_FULL_37_17]